jgi:uncharacterized protein YkwD
MTATICSLLIAQCSVLGSINADRINNNVPALRESRQLDFAAQAKANDELVNGYFAHTSPTGKTPWFFITTHGYKYIIAGENLATNFTNVKDEEIAWMNSPLHRANILNPYFKDFGVGIAAHNVVVMFGTK